MPYPVILETNLPGITRLSRGKVRDIYKVGKGSKGALLFVATDRISAFDCVLPTGIPDKGRVLNQMSIFWFNALKSIVPNHFVTSDFSLYPAELQPFAEQLDGRSMIVRKADVFPAEFVVRGYLSGSGWKDYQNTGAVCGIALLHGLRESEQLPEPIFTPATKATSGHDQNISFVELSSMIGSDMANTLKEKSLLLYKAAAKYAKSLGIILADTKFEFGLVDGQIFLVDEALTPDSSRFWPAEGYAPGRPQNSFDKQAVRDYLREIGWDQKPPAPPLPTEVVLATTVRYRAAYQLLTGKSLT